jgi:drug/metabolite transporter (DMT)-like permease
MSHWRKGVVPEVHYVAATLACVVAAVAHTLVTFGSRRAVMRSWFSVYLVPYVIAGHVLMLCASLITLWAYRVLPLKAAVGIVPIQHATVLLLARIVLHERLSRAQILGSALILIGMVVFHR